MTPLICTRATLCLHVSASAVKGPLPMLLYWLLDIGSRAVARQPLTPQERGILRFIDSLFAGVLLTAAAALLPLLTGGSIPSLDAIERVGGMAFAQALLMAFIKVAQAHADAPVAPLAPPLAPVEPVAPAAPAPAEVPANG